MSEIDRRMAEAATAEKEGRWQEAATLYDRLGRDIQAQHGPHAPRAIDAFEGIARAIGRGPSA